MSRSKGDIDAIVIGAAAMDMLAWVDQLPSKDGIELARQIEMRPGGSGANVAVAASRLGAKVGFIARISSDQHGKTLLKEFKREKVDTSACLIRNDLPTAICFIAIDSNGDRSMVALGGAGPVDAFGELDREYLGKAHLLYVTDVEPEIVKFTANKFQNKNNFLIYSPGGIIASKGLGGLTEVLPQIDVLLLSQNEAHKLLPTLSPQIAAEKLHSLGAENVVITLGSHGVLLCNTQGMTSIPSFPVDRVVDTTGAGDALAGGMIAGLLKGNSLSASILAGCAAAAIKIAQPGARMGLPNQKQLNNYLSAHILE